MNCILLLGAGFSRNWGGWLAGEVFNYLISVRELDDTCRQLLTKHRSAGFEKALGILQADRSASARGEGSSLRLMEAAIEKMFDHMGREWFRTGWTIEFTSPPETGHNNIQEFLTRFDAIFTLNQDLLLEIGYCQHAFPLVSYPRWDAPDFPGTTTRVSNPMTPASRWVGSRCPTSRDVQSVAPHNSRTQPIYKLHGSSNWVDETGERLLIMGEEKTESILASKILSLYAKEFDRRLRLPQTRLMIIGYGFQDLHINHSIDEAIACGDVRTFIIDPSGADAPDPYRNRPSRLRPAETEYPVQRVLMGVSQRPLSSTFGGDTIECESVWNFFAP